MTHWTHDRKVVSLNPGRSGGRNFFFSYLCVLTLTGVCSTPILLQWHVKDPNHSAKSAGGRSHLNMHTPLTQQSWSGLAMPLSRQSVGTFQKMSSHANSSGNTQPQLFQFAKPLWTDPGINSGISVHKLISTKKKKKAQAGNEWSNLLAKILASE